MWQEIDMESFDNYWRTQLGRTLLIGREVEPRGKLTKELLHQSLEIDMRRPVLRNPERKLDYRFMAAEAFWILSGDSRVETIAPFNSKISQFSDDGKSFFGAYGPKIMGQMPYVIDKLIEDRVSRQAVLTIWRECPPPLTKDVPCTVAMCFTLRESKINVHVFMRSSDLWLGLPYDVFNFSMVGHYVCAQLNSERFVGTIRGRISPGALYLTAVSSHLYEPNWEGAARCADAFVPGQPATPSLMCYDHNHLMWRLDKLRYSKPGDKLRWWEVDFNET
jgi:thymidylate synthase